MQVLPRGYFEFDFNGEKLKGRFCTWTLNRFCIKMNISSLSEMYTVISEGVSIHAIAEMLLCAVEYYYLKESKEFPFEEIDACDWIDEMGGLEKVAILIGESISSKELESKEPRKDEKKRKATSHGQVSKKLLVQQG